jgi:hypothetical protein
MNKKAFFIPTPGQYEQLYLAKRLDKIGNATYCKQDDFCIEKLINIERTSPLSLKNNEKTNFNELFNCFQSKRKL